MSKVDGFLKIGALKGESKDSDHKDWIDVLGWHWGMTNAGSGHLGGGSGTGKGDVMDFRFNKYVDTASTDLARHLLLGKHFDKAEFHLRKATGDAKPLLYWKVEFEHVFITSLDFGGSGTGGSFTENLSFNFKKYKAYYVEQTESGGQGAKPKYGWDLEAQKELPAG